jgi:uncharacterized protein
MEKSKFNMMNFFSHIKEGNNRWYLYIIGFIFAFIGYGIGSLPIMGVAEYYFKKFDISVKDYNRFLETMDFKILGIPNNLGFFLMLLLFVFGLLCLYMAVVYFHRKKFIYLISPFGKMDWKRFWFGFGIWFVIGLISEIISYLINPTDISFHFRPSQFFILLLISFFILPIQTSFEELLIRGYVTQGLAHLTKSKILIMIISSGIFALMHGMNPEIAKYGIGVMMCYYLTAGMFLAIITFMDDRLELALGVHFATNFYGATIITYEGSVLQTDALFLSGEIDPYLMLFGFLVIASITFYIFSSKYKWQSITYLLQPIPHEKPVLDLEP